MSIRPKLFTLDEANDLLYEIKPLAKNIMELSKVMVERLDMMRALQVIGAEEKSSPEYEELIALQEELDQIVSKINRYERVIREKGCYPKDIHIGIVDFYSFLHGELVFLCWRWGEDKIKYWHSLNKGCANRVKLIG